LVQGIRDTAFILVAHHSIADDLSLAYAIRDTLSAVSGGFLPSLPSLPAREEIFAARWGRTLTNTAEPQKRAAAQDPGIYRPLDNARPTVKGLRLAPTLTAKLRDRARREGTTVHGALSSAIAIAGRKVFADWRRIPLRVMSPINIRPLLGVGEECGVFVSAATGVLDGNAIDFWDLAREAKTAVAGGQAREGVAALQASLGEVVDKGSKVAAAAEFASVAFAHEVMLSNLGVMTFDNRFGRLRLEELWGPAVLDGMEGEHTIGVATVNGSICLTHTSYTPSQGLLEVMRDVLVNACQ
jgi:hypothetical protein